MKNFNAPLYKQTKDLEKNNIHTFKKLNVSYHIKLIADLVNVDGSINKNRRCGQKCLREELQYN